MAYNSAVKYSGNKAPVAKSAGGTNGKKTEAIFSTGLWAQEGGKSLATVQVREDIMIPAGSYINLYQSDKKDEKSPDFKIQVRPGVLKQRA